MHSSQIDHCIEILCSKGCRSVRRDIRLLEQGEVLPELASLDSPARRAVLKELRAIMAVYGDTCPITPSDDSSRGHRGHGENA